MKVVSSCHPPPLPFFRCRKRLESIEQGLASRTKEQQQQQPQSKSWWQLWWKTCWEPTKPVVKWLAHHARGSWMLNVSDQVFQATTSSASEHFMNTSVLYPYDKTLNAYPCVLCISLHFQLLFLNMRLTYSSDCKLSNSNIQVLLQLEKMQICNVLSCEPSSPWFWLHYFQKLSTQLLLIY